MAKTKAELEAESKELNALITDQEKVEQCDNAAFDLRRMYNSLIGAGFTEEQAWEVLVIQLNGAAHSKRSLF